MNELFVVNLNTSFVVVDRFIELMEDIREFCLHFLASWGGQEFLVECLKILHFLGMCPSLDGSMKVSHWLGTFNSIPNVFNVIPLLLDFFATCLVDINLDEILFII